MKNELLAKGKLRYRASGAKPPDSSMILMIKNSPKLTPTPIIIQKIEDRRLAALKRVRVSVLANLPLPSLTLLRGFSPPGKLCYNTVSGVPFSWAVPTPNKPLFLSGDWLIRDMQQLFPREGRESPWEEREEHAPTRSFSPLPAEQSSNFQERQEKS